MDGLQYNTQINMKKIMKWLESEKFLSPNLNIKTIVKGFFVAIISAILFSIGQMIQVGQINLHTILITAISAGIAYLIKNVFTNSDGDLLKRET